MICSITSSGFAIPPDQNASQTRSILLFSSPVITPAGYLDPQTQIGTAHVITGVDGHAHGRPLRRIADGAARAVDHQILDPTVAGRFRACGSPAAWTDDRALVEEREVAAHLSRSRCPARMLCHACAVKAREAWGSGAGRPTTRGKAKEPEEGLDGPEAPQGSRGPAAWALGLDRS